MKTLLILTGAVLMNAFTARCDDLQRLKYNHPGLTVDLGVGLWAWPLPMDFDGDGDLDLVVNCPDKPYNGVYFFENAIGDTAQNKMPVFKPARRISKGLQNVQVSHVNDKPQVLTPGMEYPDFQQSGLEKGIPLRVSEDLDPASMLSGRTRAKMWKQVDYDGDGKLDLVVGIGSWEDYGWDDAYNRDGVWTNGPLRGFVYVLRNTGGTETPDYQKPEQLMVHDEPLETYGWPSPNFADFDDDGDLDLLCGEFLDGFTYFENIGGRTSPVYAKGRRLTLPDGAAGFPSAWLAEREAAKLPGSPRPLTMDLEMITPTAIDWDRDGDLDLIVGDEDGRVALVENTGRFTEQNTPQFLPPVYFQQEADELKCGALSTPVGVDWDGDGDMDIISGNTAGYIAFFENLSGPGVENPKWAAPKNLEADGKVIRPMAGINGSIQGPAEAKWGYTTLNVADWDHDGLPDIVMNSILGRVMWLKNIGTRTSPKLAAAQSVEVNWNGPQPTLDYGWMKPSGDALLTQWRTTPVVVDWNDDGLNDLVMLDHEGYLAFFKREKRSDGSLALKPGERVFVDAEGEPLRLTSGHAGRSGRRKLAIVDWDGDGDLDLLANSRNAEWYRNEGTIDGRTTLVHQDHIAERNVAGHTSSPTTIDLNADGVPELLVGSEDGRFYHLPNRSTP